jgi:hypothetical protein
MKMKTKNELVIETDNRIAELDKAYRSLSLTEQRIYRKKVKSLRSELLSFREKLCNQDSKN